MTTNFLMANTWGVYAPPAPFPDCSTHYEFERLVGVKIPIMSWFSNWSIGMPKAAAEAAAGGYELQIAWMPQLNGGTVIKLQDILDGWWDDYITTFFKSCGAHPKPVTVRLMHEPNLGIYPWSANRQTACLSPEQYVATWQHIWYLLDRLDLFPKVQLQWCVATSDKGGIPMESYYPGERFVGKLGVDIYNGNGASQWWEARQLIKPWYTRLLELGDQPVWIAEIGCREPLIDEVSQPADPTHSKADWWRNLFANAEFPRITHTSFFDAVRNNDWRVNSDSECLKVIRGALKQRYPTPDAAR